MNVLFKKNHKFLGVVLGTLTLNQKFTHPEDPYLLNWHFNISVTPSFPGQDTLKLCPQCLHTGIVGCETTISGPLTSTCWGSSHLLCQWINTHVREF